MINRFLDKIQLRSLPRIADSDFLVHFCSLGIDLPSVEYVVYSNLQDCDSIRQ
jgi:hypothetical protein